MERSGFSEAATVIVALGIPLLFGCGGDVLVVAPKHQVISGEVAVLTIENHTNSEISYEACSVEIEEMLNDAFEAAKSEEESLTPCPLALYVVRAGGRGSISKLMPSDLREGMYRFQLQYSSQGKLATTYSENVEVVRP